MRPRGSAKMTACGVWWITRTTRCPASSNGRASRMQPPVEPQPCRPGRIVEHFAMLFDQPFPEALARGRHRQPVAVEVGRDQRPAPPLTRQEQGIGVAADVATDLALVEDR